MPFVFAGLVLVLAVLVFRFRADAYAEADVRVPETSATDWLTEAVDDDRHRRLIVAASTFRLR
jgi:hypothetical protein